MVARYNERITITMPKGEIKRLKKVTKWLKIPLSKWVAKTLDENIREIEYNIHLANMTQEEQEALDADLQEKIRIAKTPWLED